MKDFINERWRPVLARNGLADFDALWLHKAAWFEEPNARRGGWSGVTRCELAPHEGGALAVFLKRQENHGTPSLRHPLQGEPTFRREFRCIMRYRACGIPTPEPVFFGMRRSAGGHRAILVTEELTGFLSLEERVGRWLAHGAPTRPIRIRHIEAVAALLRTMHRHGIQHNCFFPKHVFTRAASDGRVEARVIDLEKSRWRPLKTLCALRDLDTLNRYSQGWSRCDRMRFFKAYMQTDRLTPYAKWLWRAVASRSLRKSRQTQQRALAARDGVAE